MEESNRQRPGESAPLSSQDAENRAVEMDNLTAQSILPLYGRMVSGNPSPGEAVSSASRNNLDMPATSETSGGIHNGWRNWNEHSNYLGAAVLPPYFPHFDPQYRGTDGGQLFSPHQVLVIPPHYPAAVFLPGPPHVASPSAALHAEWNPASQENFMDNTFFRPESFGRAYPSQDSIHVHYRFTRIFRSRVPSRSRSSALDSSRFISPLSSESVYPQPVDVRSYGQNAAQGFGVTSNSSPWRRTNQGYAGSVFNRNIERGGISERNMNNSNNRNRGRRDSTPNDSISPEVDSSLDSEDVGSTSGFRADNFNLQDFKTDYEHANFFVIKSWDGDHIHKSIKYNVWASTEAGNRKLDATYKDANEMEGNCPVFLFFSVNGSGRFCGVAEMVGPVDFENDADYWKQDRWRGQFPVKWHIVKDVPNRILRHILLGNNVPVTRSRDSQEVELGQGIEMIKIFKNHNAITSFLNVFDFYEECEKVLLEERAKEQASSSVNTSASPATEPMDQLSDNFADTLNLDGGENSSLADLESSSTESSSM